MANRKQQIKKIQEGAAELHSQLDELVDELQEAFDNMPESIQGSERGDAAEQRIATLSEWRDQLSEIAEEEDI